MDEECGFIFKRVYLYSNQYGKSLEFALYCSPWFDSKRGQVLSPLFLVTHFHVFQIPVSKSGSEKKRKRSHPIATPDRKIENDTPVLSTPQSLNSKDETDMSTTNVSEDVCSGDDETSENMPCILFMDSLGIHGAISIANTIYWYPTCGLFVLNLFQLFREWMEESKARWTKIWSLNNAFDWLQEFGCVYSLDTNHSHWVCRYRSKSTVTIVDYMSRCTQRWSVWSPRPQLNKKSNRNSEISFARVVLVRKTS